MVKIELTNYDWANTVAIERWICDNGIAGYVGEGNLIHVQTDTDTGVFGFSKVLFLESEEDAVAFRLKFGL
jgi:hypothetical protein